MIRNFKILLVAGFCFLNQINFAQYKKFVYIICSYNNARWYEQNLDSIKNQNYPREYWRAVYINDCSKDETGSLVANWVTKNNLLDRFTLINNPRNYKALANIYKAVHQLDDDEIAILLDGDDWLYGTEVLSYLNEVYQNPDVWLTYGGYEVWPTGERGWYKPIPQIAIQRNEYFKYDQISAHLISFYPWLFKRIKLQDLFYEGSFMQMTYDMAIMLRLFEMSAGRFKYIDDRYIYVYNFSNPISDCRVNGELQLSLDRFVRAKKPYEKLESKPEKAKTEFAIDVLCIAQSLNAARGWLQRNNINSAQHIVFIIPEEMAELVEAENTVMDCPISYSIRAWGAEKSLLSVLLNYVITVPATHYAIFTDASIPENEIDLAYNALELERTMAHSCIFARAAYADHVGGRTYACLQADISTDLTQHGILLRKDGFLASAVLLKNDIRSSEMLLAFAQAKDNEALSLFCANQLEGVL